MAVVPFPAQGGLPDSYPWPLLTATGTNRPVHVETIVLTNGHVSLTCLPAFGCRIVSMGTPWKPEMHLEPTGPRGLSWPEGIEFLAGRSPETGLAQADVRTYAQESDQVGLICGSLTPESDWHAGVTLTGAEPWATIDVRLHSRSDYPSPGQCGLRLHKHQIAATGDSCVLTRCASGTCLLWWEEPGTVAFQNPGSVDIVRASSQVPLPPRSTRAIKLRLAHLQTPEGHCFVAPGLVFSQNGDSCVLWSATAQTATLHLLPQGGSPIEPTLTLQPGTPIALDLPPGTPTIEQAALRTPTGTTHLRSEVPQPLVFDPQTTHLRHTQLQDQETLAQAAESPAHAAVALTALARLAFTKGNVPQAVAYLERAIGANPEDQALWWLSAALARESNTEPPESALLNAHYLAPHEPLLRAESFLSASNTEDAAPTALLAPFAANPDAAVDVAATLAEWQMDTALFRFCDEVLRLADIPLLRYLLADRFLTATRMEATAAEHVSLAHRTGVVPPFPFRHHESQAVLRLAQRFPQDPTLQAFADLARRGSPQR